MVAILCGFVRNLVHCLIDEVQALMEDVIVTSVQTSGDALSGEAVPVEEVSFRYGKITWTYTEFDPVTGKAKGDVSSEWNCIEYTG